MKKMGVYIGLLFLVVSVIVFVQSLRLPYTGHYGPGPGMLPLWISAIVAVLSVGYLILAWTREDKTVAQAFPKDAGWVNALAVIGTLALFLVTVNVVGFLPASILALFLMFLRGYRWYWSLALSAGVSVSVYVIFDVLLRVQLPDWDLG